ncbi:MAG: IS1380 family transposase [Candidatus Omnitrophica bacterium]|nr:IS1380 family transposase [Candidatus Omnitrophota bacterium]MBU4488039.1 IS1380 family transposase [Candidatus Omnitrophota bacterium]
MQAITKNIQWEFTDRKVTAWGGMRMFKEFLDRTEIRKVLEESCLPWPASNCGYNPVQVIESFWVSVWLGGVRFSHTAMVRFDDALKEIFGWNRMPCVSTYTRFFKKFNRECVDNVFGKINKWFFEQIPEKTITLDLDSSVITRYGSQEGSLVGYNPRKPGRPSHHPIMAFIADIRMVAHSWLRPGNTGSANGAKVFLSETMDILGKHRIGLLRADAGFFDGKFIDDIENKALEYIIAAKMNSIIKGKIQAIKNWTRIDNGIECGEFEYQAGSWQKARRITAIRQLVEERPQAGGKYLFDMHDYRYQAWVTNLGLPAPEVWRLYRQRADSENRIEELKHDFGLNGFCTKDFYATEAAFRCVMVAYNLVSLFRQAVLGLKIQPRLQTIRFQCFAIGSWIGKKYRQKVLKVSLAQKRRPWFEGLFAKIDEFSWATAFKT